MTTSYDLPFTTTVSPVVSIVSKCANDPIDTMLLPRIDNVPKQCKAFMITSDISSKYTHYLYDRPENIRTNIHDKINHIHPSSHTRYASNVIQRPKVCIPIVHLDVQSSLDRRTVSQRLKIIHRLHHHAIASFGVGEAGQKRRHRRNVERYAFING